MARGPCLAGARDDCEPLRLPLRAPMPARFLRQDYRREIYEINCYNLHWFNEVITSFRLKNKPISIMTKNESLIIKGIAILLMLFLHLFSDINAVDLCDNSIYIFGMPFVYWLAPATHPVAFFLILSGYGMCYIYDKKGVDKNRWSRVFKQYLHLWVILAVFTGIAFLLQGKNYYTNLLSVIGNYTAFIWTWNGVYWFLFPYICLSLLSPFIFKLIKGRNPILILVSF